MNFDPVCDIVILMKFIKVANGSSLRAVEFEKEQKEVFLVYPL